MPVQSISATWHWQWISWTELTNLIWLNSNESGFGQKTHTSNHSFVIYELQKNNSSQKWINPSKPKSKRVRRNRRKSPKIIKQNRHKDENRCWHLSRQTMLPKERCKCGVVCHRRFEPIQVWLHFNRKMNEFMVKLIGVHRCVGVVTQIESLFRRRTKDQIYFCFVEPGDVPADELAIYSSENVSCSERDSGNDFIHIHVTNENGVDQPVDEIRWDLVPQRRRKQFYLIQIELFTLSYSARRARALQWVI